jgi:hypothetical protein
MCRDPANRHDTFKPSLWAPLTALSIMKNSKRNNFQSAYVKGIAAPALSFGHPFGLPEHHEYRDLSRQAQLH